MENKKNDNRENHARNAEDVPFFPLTFVRMSQGQYVDEIAEAQHDFVLAAGLPANTEEKQPTTKK
jgi:hypothetical protein